MPLFIQLCTHHVRLWSAEGDAACRIPLSGTSPNDAVSCRPDWGREFLAADETLLPLTEAERARLPDAIHLSFIAYLYDWGSGNLILDNDRRMRLIEGIYG